MGLLGKLASLFRTGPDAATDDAIHIYVECERCKSVVHVRLDRRHDVSTGEDGGYFVRKEVMDSKCFRLMVAEMTFDSAYRVQRQDVQGGRFVSAADFESTDQQSPQ